MKWCLKLLQMTGLNLFYWVGVFVGFGCLFQLLEQLNTRFIYQAFGKIGLLLTGTIGTVVHEGSHAVMCLVFGHRIQEIKWFRPFAGQVDGVLGYVSHSWNRQNSYQAAGNFFIGIAPMIGGTFVMMCLFKWLLPDAYLQVKQLVRMNGYVTWISTGQYLKVVQQLGRDLGFCLKSILTSSHLCSWRGLAFVVSVYSISTHMGLSWADLKGSWTGLMMMFGISLVITLFLSILGVKIDTWMPMVMAYNVRVLFFFMIGVVFSVLTLGISWIFSIILA